jgi:hypothetical protein
MRSKELFFLGAAFLFTACGGGEESAEKTPMLVIGEGETVSSAVIHQMPTPNELFVLVRDLAGEGNKRLLNPASQADRYVSLKSRAVNFGIYSTDLVYASSFGLNVEVARYYLATKKLAEALGLSSVFTDAEFVRLESNLTRGDSLEVISNEVYMRAYERLQGEDMGPMLAMVLVGGWVESMHVMMGHREAMKGDKDILVRVAEQKATLEHLVALTETQSGNADIADLRHRMQAILDIYDQLNVQRKAHSGKSASGRMVLGDDVSLEMTEDKYKQIEEAIRSLRNDLTRTEDQPNA